MTTIGAPSNRHPRIMPLPMPSYAYRYPNPDSRPFSSIPNQTGLYNPELPGTYQWETHFPEKNIKSTYLGPDFFKEPPKQFALSPNWPRENYSPKHVNNDKILASKGYVPHFTNQTNQSWKKFLDQTPERFIREYENREIVEFNSNLTLPLLRSKTLDSGKVMKTGVGADFSPNLHMALSSQFRNNDGYRHSSLVNLNAWKPYGNEPAYFNNYIVGAPRFS